VIDGPLTEDEVTRAAAEIVRHAGSISNERLADAVHELDVLKVQATLWQLWKAGELEVGWNPDDGMVWYPK
jgi:hypothetical protein